MRKVLEKKRMHKSVEGGGKSYSKRVRNKSSELGEGAVACSGAGEVNILKKRDEILVN